MARLVAPFERKFGFRPTEDLDESPICIITDKRKFKAEILDTGGVFPELREWVVNDYPTRLCFANDRVWVLSDAV